VPIYYESRISKLSLNAADMPDSLCLKPDSGLR
jgi:hypothetical protein